MFIEGIRSTGSTSCCQVGNELVHVGKVKVYKLKVGYVLVDRDLAFRELGPACRGDYGPCGASRVKVIPSTDMKVFKPRSRSDVCGYQASASNPGDTSFPEPYTDQLQYPPVTAACPYTSCLPTGRPAVTFTLINVAATASGRVKSDPPGITVSGAGRARRTLAETITLTAEPTGRHARAVFSGGCVKTGDYGKKAECSVKLAPDPKITVTYECEKGFTCERGNKD